MDALRGFTLLLLCQSAGEALARLAHWPLPGPVLGLVLLVGLLQWPAVRVPVEAAAQPLLGHLSLLFVPVGVGVIGHLGLVGQYGARISLLVALAAFIGGLSAATGMIVVEAIAVATMVSNDLVMPLLLRSRRRDDARDLSRTPLAVRRTVIVALLLLGWLYFRIAGEAYALVSIGLISFAAVAQFAPALLGGMFWKGGTRAGALAGLGAGFALWAWTLMLPSIAKSGWIDAGFMASGPFGIGLLRPEQLLGLTGLDSLTHALLWSLLANIGLYVAVSLARAPDALQAAQALRFVDAMRRPPDADGSGPALWRGRASVDALPMAPASCVSTCCTRRASATMRSTRPAPLVCA